MTRVRPRRSFSLAAIFQEIGPFLAILSAGCAGHAAPRVDERCISVPASSAPTEGGTALKAEVVADGLEVPWNLAFLPSGDVLFTERAGRVRMIKDGALTPPILSMAVAESGEGGLLGIAVDPLFEQNRYFYIYVTLSKNGGTYNEIERYALSDDGSSARLDKVLLTGIPAARYHDGGRLKFGLDGMLYVGVGDGGVPENAHELGSWSGKILRMTRDGAVPPDNPFRGSLVYVRGVRNPEAFVFAPGGGLFIADHGPSGELGRTGHDEISRARGGDDLGWPAYYGCEVALGVTAPMLVFERATPPGGAELITGDSFGDWRGSLVVATLGSKHLHRVVLNSSGTRVALHEVYFQGDPPSGLGRLRDVVMGPDGALYVTTSNCDRRGNCPRDGDKILKITRWSPEPSRARIDVEEESERPR